MANFLLFWASLGGIFYTYIGFPLLLLARGALFKKAIHKAEITPNISLIIIAYNEAEIIAAKLENSLALDYPRDRLEIIVGSDGSSDGTNEIVAQYEDKGIQLFAYPRQGKISSLNATVPYTRGEVLVFSDANSMYEPDALTQLVSSFADPDVGCVGGNQRYISGSGSKAAGFGEQLYWNFESTLKNMQSKAGNMTSATGAMLAIRKELFQTIPSGVGDDFIMSTRVISQGYRLVFEPEALAFETVAPTEQAEFRRKVRVIVQGLWGLWIVRDLFNPVVHGFYALQIFSHKFLRWSVCWMLISLFLSSLGLYRKHKFYALVTQAQLLFYGVAASAWGLKQTSFAQLKIFKLFSIPFYFCLVNIASLMGWYQLVIGKRVDIWSSTQRTK
jgi:cellulose synthase/poly-beta-1,6-N-acetylglucosamine synthase-like glycosyltransferase